MKRCDDCRYNQEPEYNKPCVVYRADCPLYQKEGDGMTKEEAIKELREMKTDPWTDSRQMEALKVAIKALAQEPSGDLISREAVLEQINCWIGSGEYRYAMSERFLIDRIKTLPSVNPQEPCDDATLKDIFCMGCEYREQEPCEDVISRQAVLDAIKDYASMLWKKYHEPFPESTIMEIIQKLPSVIPAERTGHWIEVAKYSDGWHKIQCSECGNYIFDRGHANSFNVKEKYKYCHYCGCRMFEPQESDHKCHTCKHYLSGEQDGSCDSYICEHYSNWESEG